MSSPPPSGSWQDRRGMFQGGKHVHEPTSGGKKFHETGAVSNAIRRASTSSQSDGQKSPVADSFPTAASGRRRSSAASGGLFGNLNNMKRGSQDYGERRASHAEMMGGGGAISGWFNSTFKGVQKPADNMAQTQAQKDQKRGVME